MNIEDGSSDEPEEVQSDVKIQRVHRSGKSKNGKPRPILARFLRYKDVQKIFSLGHRLRETDFQMFSDYPAEIVRRHKEQPEDLQRGQKKQHSCIPFSLSKLDKLFRGRLWPVDKKNDH